MKLIIAGGRNITDLESESIQAFINFLEIEGITEIVSGGAKGVDKAGEIYAHVHNIPCQVFPAEWNKYGKAAGPIRNSVMANYGDALLIIWDGKSRGSADMKQRMTKLSKPVWEILY